VDVAEANGVSAISLDSLAVDSSVGITRDSAILVDDRIVATVPTGWSNVSSSSPGNSSSRCLSKTSVESPVIRYYGSLSGYAFGKPYRRSWWQKTTGEWGAQSDVARSLYYLPEHLILINKTWAATEDPLFIDLFRVRQMPNSEYALYCDDLVATHCGGIDARPFTDDSRLALLPNTMAKLRGGGTLRLMRLGDSYSGLQSFYPWESQLMRTYPQCEIIPSVAAIGSTGMDWPLNEATGKYGWDDQARIDALVIPYAPEFIVLSNKSSTWGRTPEQMSVADSKAHWASVISMLRTSLPGVELLVCSRGDGQEDTGAYAQEVAAANDCAYFDESATLNNYATDMGLTVYDLVSPDHGGDGIHLGPQGETARCRNLAAFLGAH
jgi:hypothetical protein